jgi:hypothetical protein
MESFSVPETGGFLVGKPSFFTSSREIKTLIKKVRKVLNSITKRFSKFRIGGGYVTDSDSDSEEQEEDKILVRNALEHFCCSLRHMKQTVLGGTGDLGSDEYIQLFEPHLYEKYINTILNYIDTTLETNSIHILVLEKMRDDLGESIGELIGEVSRIIETDRIRRIDEIEKCSFWTLIFLGLIVVFGSLMITFFFQK